MILVKLRCLNYYMKQTLFTFAAIVMFCSCGQDHNSSTAKKSTSTTHADSVQLLVRQFAPFINGFWVQKDYVKAMKSTKSPRIAYERVKSDVIAIRINLDDIKGDSLRMPTAISNHEAGWMYLKVKSGHNNQTLATNNLPGSDFSELGYEVKSGDTNVVIYHYAPNKRLIEAISYIKELPQTNPENKLVNVGYRIVNQVLIAGNYSTTDSNGHPEMVKMDNEGNITGFGDFSAYEVNIDFAEGMLENLDDIKFTNTGGKDRPSYIFKIDADTLNLYQELQNADSTELVKGRLIYRLVKSKVK